VALKKIFRVLQTKVGAFVSLIILVFTLSGVIYAVMSQSFGAIVPVLLLGAVLYSILVLQLEMLRSVRQTRKDLRNVQAVTEKNDRNLLRVRKTVNDVAGTTGRAAPLIRSISTLSTSAYNRLESLNTVPGVSNPPQVETTKPTIPAPALKNTSIMSVRDVQHPALKLPSVNSRKVLPRTEHKVMVIADEFTAAAFESEWHQIRPTPKNWRELLDSHEISMLFVESAWEGNDGAWKYHLVGQSAPRPAVIELVTECRQRRIPAVFWNKEDPPHFKDFLETAKLADFVFTTEGDLVDEYIQILGHDQVQVLPFAAQVTMHNPARPGTQRRDRDIAFGGTYFQHKYPERKQQLEYLLPAASKFKLDIFSRLYENDAKYQFPKPFDQYVRGKLEYPKMVGAYHAYKVVLNVNSVVDSETMCARRIFEATASGAAVVSAPSKAIDNYFPGGLITTGNNEDSTYHRIRTLLRSPKFRDRLVHRAQRHLWENHTYEHRANQVLRTVGLRSTLTSPSVSIIVTTNRPGSVKYLVENVVRQSYQNKELVLLTHGFTPNPLEITRLHELGIPVVSFEAPGEWQLGRNLNHLVDMASGDVIVRMDDDDWYGTDYIRDAVNALFYSGACLVGKGASYIYFQEKDMTILSYEAHEHRYTDFVRGATFTASRDVFRNYRFPEVGVAGDSAVLQRIASDGALVYSADRFNFIVNRWSDKSRHTWTVSDDQLLATGEVKFLGPGYEQVNV